MRRTRLLAISSNPKAILVLAKPKRKLARVFECKSLQGNRQAIYLPSGHRIFILIAILSAKKSQLHIASTWVEASLGLSLHIDKTRSLAFLDSMAQINCGTFTRQLS